MRIVCAIFDIFRSKCRGNARFSPAFSAPCLRNGHLDRKRRKNVPEMYIVAFTRIKKRLSKERERKNEELPVYESIAPTVGNSSLFYHSFSALRCVYRITACAQAFQHIFPRYCSSRKAISGLSGQRCGAAVRAKRMRTGSAGSSAGQSGRDSPWESVPLGSPVRMKLHQ